ncbi:Ancylostoma secreted protein [Toxocara canis]|uniref:Ancylostoma secreted protein n=1 Tax=Toxocara canis TaxID=6265 RepID=A0A0B2VXX4_TOXCA|nr:Ancylostoma secreted protein [Toxocara canis]
MNMLLLAVLLLATTSIASGIECPNVANPVFDATSRAAVLAKHNEYRAMLTHGTAQYKGGHNLKSGKNIYELVWDCDLEKHAQNWSNNCEFKHSHTPEQGGVQAVESWWSELQKYDASVNPNMDFNDGVFSVAGHWSQLAWGATTKVGCGLANCGSGGSAFIKVTCNYVIPGNMQGAVIFQLGNGCSSDSECTTYPESKCNVTSKLCMQKQAQTTPAQPGPQTTQATPVQPGAQTTQATPGKPGPQTTQPAKPEVTPTPGACEDTATDCAMYASYCFIQPYSRMLQRRCKKTCNVCDCQDIDANCASQQTKVQRKGRDVESVRKTESATAPLTTSRHFGAPIPVFKCSEKYSQAKRQDCHRLSRQSLSASQVRGCGGACIRSMFGAHWARQKQAQTTPAQPGPQTTQATPVQPGAQTTQATPGKPGPQTTQPAKPEVTPTPGACEDTATDCAMYASYCFIQPYSRMLQRRCKKTCNVCDCQDIDANCASQVNSCNLADVSTKCQLTCGNCGGCSDDANNCALMSYLCNDPTFGSVMKARCKKTCNFC